MSRTDDHEEKWGRIEDAWAKYKGDERLAPEERRRFNPTKDRERDWLEAYEQEQEQSG